MSSPDEKQALMARQIHLEANDALRKAGIYAAILGIGNGLIIGELLLTRAIENVALAGAFCSQTVALVAPEMEKLQNVKNI